MPERLTAVVDVDYGSFMRGMSRVDQRLAQTSNRMGSAGRVAAGFGKTAAIGAIGAAAGLGVLGVAAGKVGLQYAAAKQQARVAFTVMLGDGKKAVKMMRDLERFAAATPFEMSDLQTAAQRMLALGWASKKVLPDLRTIGDAAAASPQGMVEGLNRITLALGQMKSKGKASADEMLQLAEAGIPAWKFLAQAAHKSVADIQKDVTKGAVSADFAVEAILTGMRTKFGGMMREQSKTLGGSFSTLKDTVTQGLGAMLEPIVPRLTAVSQRLSAFLGSADGKAFARSVGGGIQTVIGKLGDLGGWIVDHRDDIEKVGSLLADGLRAAGDAASWLGNALGKIPVDDIAHVAEEVWNLADALGFGAAIDALGRVGGAVGDLVGPLGDAEAKTLSVADAWSVVKQKALDANRTIVNLATTVGQRNQAREDVAKARKDLAGANTLAETRAATRELSAAQARLIELNRRVKEENAASVHDQVSGFLEVSAAKARADSAVEASMKKLQGLRDGEARQVENLRKAQQTGNDATVKQEQDKLDRIRESIQKEQDVLGRAQKTRDEANVAYAKTLGRTTAMDVARNRAMAEVPALSNRSAAAIARLGRGYASAGAAGQAAAANLVKIGSSGKTTDGQVQKIAALTKKAQELGRTKAALKITAESKTADEAIKRLDKLTKAPKTTNIVIEVAGKKAMDLALALYPKIKKGVKADATIGVSGIGEMRNAISHLDLLRNRNGQKTHVYVVTHERNAKAAGGVVPAAARGGRYSAPTYLVAEAGYPEWVIPTDPKYRSRARAFVAAAAHDVGVPGFKRGGLAPSTRFPWKQFKRAGLSKEEAMMQRWEEDTAILQRQWSRSGDTMDPKEYGKLAGRLVGQRSMAMRLRANYKAATVSLGARIAKLDAAKPKDKDSDAYRAWQDKRQALVDRRREVSEKFDAMRNTILGLTEDIADARAGREKAQKEIDDAARQKKEEDRRAANERTGMVGDVVVAGLRSLDEKIAIARAGLGGNLVDLLAERKRMLEAAFASSRSQTDRAALASEISSTASDLAAARDAAAAPASGDTGSGSGSGSGGGGGGSAGPTTITNTLNLTVEGSIMTERDIADMVLRTFVEWARSGRQPLASVGFGG